MAAVITADIVNSTQLTKAGERKLMKAISLLLKDYKYEFYRGDSFQLYMKSPLDSLRIVLQLRALAIKQSEESAVPHDVRASIGIAPVHLPVKELKTASGEAFILSGRTFDEMESGQRLVIRCLNNDLINLGMKILASFIDYLFQRLTAKQAAVIYELLQNRTQKEIAKILKKSQATINKHAYAAGWPQIKTLLSDYQHLIEKIEH